MSAAESTSTLAAQTTGIVSIGAYIPRTRLSRSAIATANLWANPNLKSRGKGVRAICAHDEDSLTMAVAAARQAQTKQQPATAIEQLLFASTTLPFADRQNATVIGEALALPEQLHSSDFSGSLRCGSSALITALQQPRSSLVVAADQRQTRPASLQEMTVGDGAAAIITGTENLLAKFIGACSLSIDLTDHYRALQSDFDYQLEERWIRDEGYLKIIPQAIQQLLKQQPDIDAASIQHLIVTGPDQRTIDTIAKQCGIAEQAVRDNLSLQCGNTGAAHPLLMLAHALEQAKPGDRLLVAGFGQGCDVLLLEATEKVLELNKQAPLQTLIDNGVEDDNYQRYLSFAGLVELDWGMRAERDNRTAHSAFYRHRKTVTGFIGGRCIACDTPQFPRKPFCANPQCRSDKGQIDEPFKDKKAAVKSFTEDWLALSYNPPFKYGNVRFEGGGIVMMEFADFKPGELEVGTPVSMQFRIKDQDNKRDFKRYFWKATPLLPR
ncbi:3-oxoacyl-[acyl-carrier-protein] synthase III C-terminal domain-containing protein [Dasania marina]|uniref:3-oxoacyl-[acyl-carrier-protein] synthase III C-terminal domain-containing protein n=1 Tax=Dasania marina TaxID=471499 RepID=UPI0006869AB7|nr:3-oxoacyl-[acyl-carrier-protein] synthase III C-terminal domain-containing protein [Dasania marina]